MVKQFTECEALSFNYSIMGIVTITYSIMHKADVQPVIKNRIEEGGQVFEGVITNISVTRVPRTLEWYETTVILIATTVT